MENKWRVVYGIHRGTLMSRDESHAEFDREDEARDYLSKIIKDYTAPYGQFGYVLWFASLWNPEGEQIKQINGYPYSR